MRIAHSSTAALPAAFRRLQRLEGLIDDLIIDLPRPAEGSPENNRCRIHEQSASRIPRSFSSLPVAHGQAAAGTAGRFDLIIAD